jgi:hypothetical protein
MPLSVPASLLVERSSLTTHRPSSTGSGGRDSTSVGGDDLASLPSPGGAATAVAPAVPLSRIVPQLLATVYRSGGRPPAGTQAPPALPRWPSSQRDVREKALCCVRRHTTAATAASVPSSSSAPASQDYAAYFVPSTFSRALPVPATLSVSSRITDGGVDVFPSFSAALEAHDLFMLRQLRSAAAAATAAGTSWVFVEALLRLELLSPYFLASPRVEAALRELCEAWRRWSAAWRA